MRPDNLQKYAADRHEPGAKLLQQLAAHGCNVHWLITGGGVMLVEDIGGAETTGEHREMLEVLKSAGIEDARTLEALIADLHAIHSAHESLRSHLGNEIPKPTDQKTKKSGR